MGGFRGLESQFFLPSSASRAALSVFPPSLFSLSLSFPLRSTSSPYLQVVRGRSQELGVAVVGRVAAPELRDLAHGTASSVFVF